MYKRLLGLAGASWAFACLYFGMSPPAHADMIYGWTFSGSIPDSPCCSGGGYLIITTPGNEGQFTITAVPGSAWNTSIATLQIKDPITGAPIRNYLTPGLCAGSPCNDINDLNAGFVLGTIDLNVGPNNSQVSIKVRPFNGVRTYIAFDSQFPGVNITGKFKLYPLGAPGPIAGAGLPFLAIGYAAYWLIKRRRCKTKFPVY